VAAVRYRLRSLLRRGWRTTFAIALIVAIAGGLALTLVAGALRTLSAPDRYVDSQADVFDAEVQQQHGAPRSEELAKLPAAAHVETATFVFGGLIAPGSKDPENLLVFAGSPTPVGGHVVQGRAPAPDRPNEFVVSRSLFKSARLKLGDHFKLVTYSVAQAKAKGFDAGAPKGLSLEATLVGVVDEPAKSDNSVIALFPRSLLDAGDVGAAITVGSVGLAPGATVKDLRSQLAGLPRGEEFSVKEASPIASDVRTAVSAQGQGLAVLAIIAAGATIVVLGQLLSRQYRRSDDERVVLSSLGLTRTQLVAEPVAQAATAVITGTLAAVALAYLCSGLFPRGFVEGIEPDPGRLLDPIVHVIGPILLIVALLGWLLCSLVANRQESAPLRSTGRVNRLARAVPSVATALGLQFALGRGPGRRRAARVPFIGLILIAGLVFGALTFGRNLGLIIGEPARYGVNFDYGLGQGGKITRADVKPLLDDPNLARDIVGLTLYGSLRLNAGRAPLDIIGMDPLRGHLVPDVLSGRLPAGSDEIAIGRVSARKLDVNIGDTIKLSTKAGQKVVQVTGTVQPPSVSGADVVGDAGVVTAEGFRRVAPSQPMDSAVIDLTPGAPADTRKRIAAATGMSAGQVDPPPAVINIRRVRSIPFLVAALVAAFAMLSLGHQLLVAVRRRRLDLAVLRALGASRRIVTGVIHVQATIVTGAVLLVAIPLGVAAGAAISRPFVDRIGARNDLVVPVGWILASAAGLLVMANLVAAVPARRARRTPPSQTLARS